MMLHGLGCREPWDMDKQSAAVYQTYGKLHLALRPIFERYGQEAAQGGAPMMRMMPLAFPEIEEGDCVLLAAATTCRREQEHVIVDEAFSEAAACQSEQNPVEAGQGLDEAVVHVSLSSTATPTT